MTLKPFNLEAALAGDPVVTRDGKKVRLLRHINQSAIQGVIDSGEHFYCCVWNKSGKFASLRSDSPNDLFMEEEEVEKWIILFSRYSGLLEVFTFDSEEAAQNHLNALRIKLNIRILGDQVHKITYPKEPSKAR